SRGGSRWKKRLKEGTRCTGAAATMRSSSMDFSVLLKAVEWLCTGGFAPANAKMPNAKNKALLAFGIRHSALTVRLEPHVHHKIPRPAAQVDLVAEEAVGDAAGVAFDLLVTQLAADGEDVEGKDRKS